MTNAERKTHVIRILGTNKAGDILPDMWADVERIDEMEIRTQVIQGPGGLVNPYQKVTIKLRWLDDPDAPNYDEKGDKNREHKIVKVCDPSQTDLDDPDEWIPIRSIVRMEFKHAGGNIIKHFKESVANSDIDSRVISNRRITHWDTTIDDAAQAAFDADPTRKVYVEPDGNRKYERIEGTEDEDQYVEHQIVKKLNRQDSQQLLSTGNDQRRVLYLRNQYQIDESHEAKLEELGKGEINPPYRLDPFQNIINVQWQTGIAPSLVLSWSAYMVDVSSGGAPPFWEPDTETVMTVNVDGLPSLAKTTLVVHPRFKPHVPGVPFEWDLSTFKDHVEGTFPDGPAGKPDSKTIHAEYSAEQPFGSAGVGGSVGYHTNATRKPFNGESVVSITITVHLRPIEVRDHGYLWFANATAVAKGLSDNSGSDLKTTSGTVGSGGTLTFTATLHLKDGPPTLDLS